MLSIDEPRVRRAVGCVALFVSYILAAGGCNVDRPARVPVSGQVLIDGQPLTQGFVRFVPEGARPSGGDIGPDGRFTLTCYDGQDGAVPGKHRVEVVSRRQIDGYSAEWFAPKKYTSIDTSGLEVEIAEPTDSLTLSLTWGGGKPFVERYGR